MPINSSGQVVLPKINIKNTRGSTISDIQRQQIFNSYNTLMTNPAGREFIRALPVEINVFYVEGPGTAQANKIGSKIYVYETDFGGVTNPNIPAFSLVKTLWHEAGHLIAGGLSLDDSMRISYRSWSHMQQGRQGDQNFDYIVAPLKNIVAEESRIEKFVGLIFELGYGRNIEDNYYVLDDSVPAAGAARETLTAADKQKITTAIQSLKSNNLSIAQKKSNLENFQEYIRRTKNAGWLSESIELKGLRKSVEAELKLRGISRKVKFAPISNFDEDFFINYEEHGNIVSYVLVRTDANGSQVETGRIDLIYLLDENGMPKKDGFGNFLPPTGETLHKDGIVADYAYDSNGNKVSANVRLANAPLGFEFNDIGSILGQQLGYRLSGGNALLSVVYSTSLSTVGDALGDLLDGVFSGGKISTAAEKAFSEFGKEFLTNLKSAGIGAVSSYLTAELVNAIGLGGFAGEFAPHDGLAGIEYLRQRRTHQRHADRIGC
jgi:hypothetical protein